MGWPAALPDPSVHSSIASSIAYRIRPRHLLSSGVFPFFFLGTLALNLQHTPPFLALHVTTLQPPLSTQQLPPNGFRGSELNSFISILAFNIRFETI